MSLPLILIIESNEWFGEQYERVLKSEYRVMLASNSRAAMQIIDSTMPDAIITDILLTGGTVFALLHELQSYADTGDIPVILCTSLANELSIDDLRPYGVKSIIDKTLMVPSDLPNAVKKVLS